MLHDTGLDHRAIHGWEADTVSISRRYDVAAHTRRVASTIGRRVVTAGFGTASFLTAIAAILDGSWSVGLVAVAFAAASIVAYRSPDWVYDAPDPAFERGSLSVDGMTDKEVMRRFAIARERDAYEAERKEEARKREERKAKARRNV